MFSQQKSLKSFLALILGETIGDTIKDKIHLAVSGIRWTRPLDFLLPHIPVVQQNLFNWTLILADIWRHDTQHNDI